MDVVGSNHFEVLSGLMQEAWWQGFYQGTIAASAFVSCTWASCLLSIRIAGFFKSHT